MNRETELHFSGVPSLHKPRSKMVIPNDLVTSMDSADLVPIFCDPDILPGDTVKMKMASVIRMSTPLYPIFGNIVADIMFFYVPYRLVWEHWKEFWGENPNTWYQTVQYTVPQIQTLSTGGFGAKTLGDYLACPTGVNGISVNALPFRCYVKIWNDWFRSESLQQEAPNITTDSNVSYNATYAYTGGALLKVNKLMDCYTGCLPAPQKGPSVTLPLGSWSPVMTRQDIFVPTQTPLGGNYPLTWSKTDNAVFSNNNKLSLAIMQDPTQTKSAATLQGANSSSTADTQFYPNNLWADLTNATSATINDIRMAFQIQKFYEAQTNGSRYIEFVKNIFGVTSPDARMQRSEYLGGKRIGLNIHTVLQTSSTDNTSPQGNTAAYSHTADADEYFTHSFSEHGCLMGFIAIRYYRSYDQGIPKGFLRKNWYDYYVPQFAMLGNQPVYNAEIYAQGTSTDNEVFGYQEAWANGYRYHNSTATGAMRTTYAQTLDSWHLADHYTAKPVLGSSWIAEDKANIDRTLAVGSNNENQFFGDFYFRPVYTRVMPLYSVPGLLDHF